MKKSFLKIFLSTLALSLGLGSCQKASGTGTCKDCATFTNGTDSGSFCVGDADTKTQAEFDSYVTSLRGDGYTVTVKCK